MRFGKMIILLVLLALFGMGCTVLLDAGELQEQPAAETAPPNLAIEPVTIENADTEGGEAPDEKPEAIPVPDTLIPVHEYLIETLVVPAEAVKLLSYETASFPDGCMGLGRPDERCTEAEIDGLISYWRVYEYELAVRSTSNGFWSRIDNRDAQLPRSLLLQWEGGEFRLVVQLKSPQAGQYTLYNMSDNSVLVSGDLPAVDLEKLRTMQTAYLACGWADGSSRFTFSGQGPAVMNWGEREAFDQYLMELTARLKTG